MTLQQIQDFLAVAQHGSLHAAARTTGQAQPGISKSLRRLEESVGATLLLRGAKGIQLSPFGERFLVHARLIAAEAERGQLAVREMLGETSGVVRFGISPMSSLMMAAGALSAFRREHSVTRVQSTSGLFHTLAPMLREGQLDFAICPTPAANAADFTDQTLLECDVAIVGRPDHPLAGARSLAELTGARFVMGAPQGIAGSGIAGAFLRAGLPMPTIDMQADNLVDTLSIVSGSDRLALAPALVLESPLLKGALVQIPVQESLERFRISLIARRGSPMTSTASRLCLMFEREAAYLTTAQRSRRRGS